MEVTNVNQAQDTSVSNLLYWRLVGTLEISKTSLAEDARELKLISSILQGTHFRWFAHRLQRYQRQQPRQDVQFATIELMRVRLSISPSIALRETDSQSLRAGETTAGMLGGNVVVLPKLFDTYYPKVTRFGNGAATSLKSRLPRRHTESSASWSDEHGISNVLQDYTKLKDSNAHAPTTFPSNGGHGPHTVVSTTVSGYDSKHDFMEFDDGTDMYNGIRKTVRVDQGVQYG